MRSAINFKLRVCADVVYKMKTLLFVYSKFFAGFLKTFVTTAEEVKKFLLKSFAEKHVIFLITFLSLR